MTRQYQITCPTCSGTKKIAQSVPILNHFNYVVGYKTVYVTCPQCSGTGKVWTQA